MVRYVLRSSAFKACELNLATKIIHPVWHSLSYLMVMLMIAGNSYEALYIIQGLMLSAFLEPTHPCEVDMNYYPHSTKWVYWGWGDSILLMVTWVNLCGNGSQTHACQISKYILLEPQWGSRFQEGGILNLSCQALIFCSKDRHHSAAWMHDCWLGSVALPKKSGFSLLVNEKHAHGSLGMRWNWWMLWIHWSTR